MRLQIQVNPETQVIEDAKFKTFGCGSAIASSSLATEWVKGKTVAEALAISNTDIVKELALPPVKIHCSVLAEDAIRAAIGDWKKKNNVAETAAAAVCGSLRLDRQEHRHNGSGACILVASLPCCISGKDEDMAMVTLQTAAEMEAHEAASSCGQKKIRLPG